MNASATYQSLWHGAVPTKAPVVRQVSLTQAVVDRVLAEVCEGSAVRPRDILSHDKTRTTIVPLRHEVMYRLRAMTGSTGKPLYSYPSIAKRLNRDHTSVIAGVRRHIERIRGAEYSCEQSVDNSAQLVEAE